MSGFGACGNTWDIEEALEVDVLMHNLARIAEGGLDLVLSVQLLRPQN